MITMSPVASVRAVWIAAPFPLFTSWRAMRIVPPLAAARAVRRS